MPRDNTAAIYLKKLGTDSSGFTLIETLIYIAFFGLLVGSLLGITFQTIQSSDQISKKIAVQQEANFILRKIDWALTGASAAIVQNGGTQLLVTKSTSTLLFYRDSSTVYLNNDDNSLNSDNVSVSDLQFSEFTGTSTPKKIIADFSVGSENFELTKYLR